MGEVIDDPDGTMALQAHRGSRTIVENEERGGRRGSPRAGLPVIVVPHLVVEVVTLAMR
jgi:hypothetical protein